MEFLLSPRISFNRAPETQRMTDNDETVIENLNLELISINDHAWTKEIQGHYKTTDKHNDDSEFNF